MFHQARIILYTSFFTGPQGVSDSLRAHAGISRQPEQLRDNARRVDCKRRTVHQFL